MIILSLIAWAVFVYGAYAALRGSPVIGLVHGWSEAEYEAAAKVFDAADNEDPLDPPEDVARQLSIYVRRSIVAFLAGGFEIGIVLWLLVENTLGWIFWAMVLKQAVSWPLEWRQRRISNNQIRMLRLLPNWFRYWTRFAYALTAALCLLLFLSLNNLL